MHSLRKRNQSALKKNYFFNHYSGDRVISNIYVFVCKGLSNKPEEVFATKKLSVAREAFVAQETVTVGALYACAVPRPVQHVQQKLINDRQLAPRTHYHHRCTDPTSGSKKNSNANTLYR